MSANNKGGEGRGRLEILNRSSTAAIASVALFLTGCFGGGKTETTPGPAPTVAGELTPEASVNPNATTEAPQPNPTTETPEQKLIREFEERREHLVKYINMSNGEWSALAPEKKHEVLGLTLEVARERAALELIEKDECNKYESVLLEGKFDPASAPPDTTMAALLAYRQAVLLTHNSLGIATGSANLADDFVRRMANVMLPDDPELTSPLGDPIRKELEKGRIVDVSCVPPMIMGAKDPENQPGGVVRRKIAISDYYGLTDVTIDWHPTEHGSVPVVVRQLSSGAFL
ncbi:MAG: hypothetical protein Q4B05_03770 [Candidatus Saccharibacteria bacterium]|nr:hypothetical protein [Candidatus Saccharibacteria bacterium]